MDAAAEPRRLGPLREATELEARTAEARVEWLSHREASRAEAERTEAPEAYERLGTAAWWLQLTDEMLEARLAAYRLYRARGDSAGAARMATALGNDFFDFRGDPAVANGWFRRAARLLDTEPPSVLHAWLRTWEARLALMGRQDTAAGLAQAEEALELARGCGCTDAEMLALAMRGLARVIAGDTAEGMSQLDEAAAAALGGDVDDAYAAGLTCCYLISACERVRDYERAGQWCARLREFLSEQRFAVLLTQCRLQYSSVLIAAGAWAEAESELLAAVRELATARPLVLPAAHARLGELRRRQGRDAEAAEHFGQAGGHAIAQLGLGWLEMGRGEPAMAAERAGACLRRFAPGLLIERAPANELAVRSALGLGDVAGARRARAELEAAAESHALPYLSAMALAAAGTVAAAEGAPDRAAEHAGRAADLYEEAALPWEAAWTREAEALALAATGRPQAVLAAVAANAAFARLGIERTVTLPAAPAPVAVAGSSAEGPLSRREAEVLRLVADGLSERDIAARLFISVHTVHRHLSNIRTKLGVPSRAAAVALALREGLL
ncbi:MAG TPA: helix-turn-helix transcriptional regulator [Longimicrobiales bacterium]|nr:helix-turn-helix transcriptional regulator [Longimicrobiales bacterium]